MAPAAVRPVAGSPFKIETIFACPRGGFVTLLDAKLGRGGGTSHRKWRGKRNEKKAIAAGGQQHPGSHHLNGAAVPALSAAMLQCPDWEGGAGPWRRVLNIKG